MATTPLGLTWSATAYGPGGPWNAVKMSVGSPPQAIDLIPGGSWESPVLGSTICSGRSSASSKCLADPTRLYDSSRSSTQAGLSGTNVIVDSNFAPSIGALSFITGSAKYVFDTATFLFTDANTRIIPKFDMLVISEGHSTLPNGTTFPLETGYLSLGAPEANQSWVNGTGRFAANMLSSYFWATGAIASYSYGMHIGSPTIGLPGSLYIGGYDQSRVVGPVTYQPPGQNWLPIDLLDIGIKVAVGESPFNFTSKANLLVQDNGRTNGSLAVTVEPRDPHLHLPQATCDAIADLLPVVFAPDLGLYLWDTNSPLYNRIITSPAVLSFTFRLSRSLTSIVTISVPFPLLALTLAPPLAPSPAGLKYFPCAPLLVGATSANGAPAAILGRAFLQAAFIGVNWSDQSGATWFMAQAPGPNTPGTASIEEISAVKTNIVQSPNEWIRSWNGGWSVLETVGTTDSVSAPSATGSDVAETRNTASLPAAAKVGVGIGIGILIFAILASFLLWRRKRTTSNQQIGQPIQADFRMELDTKRSAEQDWKLDPYELDSHKPTRSMAELA
ncbi:hypothetical protein VTL71DRAFT_9989 [Oculimacula yallundae]|uniref:Peptidase A1 domain-containing protein n=1 Tax=Oculimacula yallundae TaxID=86028 RepID=A0ABR4BPZ9_9HELO